MGFPPTSNISVSPGHLGIVRSADVPVESLKTVNQLLEKNHKEHHIFFKDLGGHNHIVHNLLTILALGASPSELQKAFDGNTSYQRPKPKIDQDVVKSLDNESEFHTCVGDPAQYTNFLVFFEQKIEEKGWKTVVNEYCFAGTRNADAVLAGMYEGAYHSFIHLGLGVEFELPVIIAEALAQAASHPSANIDKFFLNCEKEARNSDAGPSKTLVELLQEVRTNDKIRNAPRWTDGPHKVRDGVLGRAGSEMTGLAAQFSVKAEEVERKTAEMINCCAYFAGAAQRAGKARKIDFFYMHAVTSSIFFTVLVRQAWINMETKARLVEWKGRLDLVWYAACGSPELHVEAIKEYQGTASAGMSWSDLFSAVNSIDDDGHVSKLLRALKNGEEVCAQFEESEAFPMKKDMWLKLAHMTYDSTWNVATAAKWIAFAGFEQPWGGQPDL